MLDQVSEPKDPNLVADYIDGDRSCDIESRVDAFTRLKKRLVYGFRPARRELLVTTFFTLMFNVEFFIGTGRRHLLASELP